MFPNQSNVILCTSADSCEAPQKPLRLCVHARKSDPSLADAIDLQGAILAVARRQLKL